MFIFAFHGSIHTIGVGLLAVPQKTFSVTESPATSHMGNEIADELKKLRAAEPYIGFGIETF